jgi:hypothetical protein
VATILARIRLILRLGAAFLAFLTFVWVAAVRLLPEVKRRKARRRELGPRARRPGRSRAARGP